MNRRQLLARRLHPRRFWRLINLYFWCIWFHYWKPDPYSWNGAMYAREWCWACEWEFAPTDQVVNTVSVTR